MNHTVNGRVLLENLIESLLVGHIELVEGRTAAGQQLNAVEGNLGRVVEGVDNDNIVTVLKQGKRGEGANVASATARSKNEVVSNGLFL